MSILELAISKARARLAEAQSDEERFVRLAVLTGLTMLKTEAAALEAGEAPAPVPALPPSIGEGGGGNHPRPRPRAPQGMEQATKTGKEHR
jgi:hypothetical protein